LKPSVLLDTNIIVSGLVFRRGKEHELLRLVEDGVLLLVLPDYVVAEAKRVLAAKFQGYEGLLDIFLERVGYRVVAWEETRPLVSAALLKVRDVKDAVVLASILAVDPDYFVTGDRELREDAAACLGADRSLTSSQLLERLRQLVTRAKE
jgi:putative PIN family toxin of toxin-antitoxin system